MRQNIFQTCGCEIFYKINKEINSFLILFLRPQKNYNPNIKSLTLSISYNPKIIHLPLYPYHVPLVHTETPPTAPLQTIVDDSSPSLGHRQTLMRILGGLHAVTRSLWSLIQVREPPHNPYLLEVIACSQSSEPLAQTSKLVISSRTCHIQCYQTSS